jgi:OHCU decarboxylase
MISLGQLNLADIDQFVAVCGPLFEHSPWVAERTAPHRPFASLADLHTAMCNAVSSATLADQVKLIASHPDLVGRLAREGGLTRESTAEQAAAGLDSLSADEIAAFERYNQAYRDKFSFPFVICARENKKSAILAAFPLRLQNTREQEISTALTEIYKIAKLRLLNAVSE